MTHSLHNTPKDCSDGNLANQLINLQQWKSEINSFATTVEQELQQLSALLHVAHDPTSPTAMDASPATSHPTITSDQSSETTTDSDETISLDRWASEPANSESAETPANDIPANIENKTECEEENTAPPEELEADTTLRAELATHRLSSLRERLQRLQASDHFTTDDPTSPSHSIESPPIEEPQESSQ